MAVLDDLGRELAIEQATLQGADALIVVTEWQMFRSPDFDMIKQSLKSPVIFDGRNIYDPVKIRERGFYYHSIGRKSVAAHDPASA